MDDKGEVLKLRLKGVPKTTSELVEENNPDKKKKEGGPTNPMTNPQMMFGTFIHGMVEGYFNGKGDSAGSLHEYMNRIVSMYPHESDFPLAQVVYTAERRMVKASEALAQEIDDALDPNLRHFFFTETRFKKGPLDAERLEDLAAKPGVKDLIEDSGYEDLRFMVKALLLSDEGEIKIGDHQYNLEQMSKIVNVARREEKKEGEKSVGLGDVLQSTNIIPQEESTLDLMELLVGAAAFNYFSTRENGVLLGLLTAAVARSDILVMSAAPGSSAETFLKGTKDELFNYDMLDVRKFEKNRKLYEKLLELIMTGEIKTTLCDIKVTTVDEIVDMEGIHHHTKFIEVKKQSESKKPVWGQEGYQALDEKYGWDLAHTTQAMVQALMGMERFLTTEKAKGLNDILMINTTDDPEEKKRILRDFKKYTKLLNNQQFLVARMAYPFLVQLKTSKTGGMFSINLELMNQRRPRMAVNELDARVSIRHRLSRSYRYMSQRVAEEEEKDRLEAGMGIK